MVKYKCTKDVWYSGILIASKGEIIEVKDGTISNLSRRATYPCKETIHDMLRTKTLILYEEVKPDKVNHPSHYTWLKDKCGIEVIDIIRHLDFDKGNAIKYLLRSGYKTEEGYSDKEKEIEDLKKAIWYINDKIKQLEK